MGWEGMGKAGRQAGWQAQSPSGEPGQGATGQQACIGW